MNKTSPMKSIGFYLLILLVVILGATFFNQGSGGDEVPYSDMVKLLDEGKIKKVTLTGTEVLMEFKEDKSGKNENKDIKQNISGYWMEDFQKHLETARKEKGLIYTSKTPIQIGAYVNTILTVIMFGAMVFFIWLLFSKNSGDSKTAINFGRSRAKMADPTKNRVTFDDVAGAEEEKHELTEVVDFLKNPQKYNALGAKIPRGILLVGPPGTGKTLLAKAVAGEAGVPFFSISGSDFVEMFVGVGASRVRDLFEQAKKHAPAIIFIDEIDAVGRQRGAGLGGGHDEREQTLNQLLVEMDGFGPNEAAIVMAATNRPDILDPALLRPGRFDRRITVLRPDIKGRFEILNVHAKNKPLDADVDLKEVARITPGFTGADLANLLNEAALLAARENKKVIQYKDVSEAVFKVMIGPEKKSRIISPEEKKLTAYHEAGHAIIIRVMSETERVERVSIIPAGAAGGYTAHKAHEDRYYETKNQLIAEIMVALGGRAAEEIAFDEISTGASSDLQQANATARSMICKYGMSDKLGNMVLSSDDEVFIGREYGHRTQYSEELSSKIDEEVGEVIKTSYGKTIQILKEREAALSAIAEALLEKEKIDEFEFEKIYLENTSPELREKDAVNKARDESYQILLKQREEAGQSSDS